MVLRPGVLISDLGAAVIFVGTRTYPALTTSWRCGVVSGDGEQKMETREDAGCGLGAWRKLQGGSLGEQEVVIGSAFGVGTGAMTF